MAVFADIIGTLRTTFRINKATFDAAGLTVARTFTWPDQAGTVKLQDKAEAAAAKLYASRNLR
jgi:hypothetical protein